MNVGTIVQIQYEVYKRNHFRRFINFQFGPDINARNYKPGPTNHCPLDFLMAFLGRKQVEASPSIKV